MMGNVVLSDDILKIIEGAVSRAVQETKSQIENISTPETAAGTRNYFKIMEKLLYSYPALKRIVSDKEAYTAVEMRERSKSIVQSNIVAQWKSRDDVIEELEQEKEAEYDKTLKDFLRIERVIQEFRDRKEFVVVRLYYFKEHIDGSPRAEDEENATWDEVAFELEEAGILKEVKTARRWRNEIVNDMALCLFGIDAAIQAGTIGNR